MGTSDNEQLLERLKTSLAEVDAQLSITSRSELLPHLRSILNEWKAEIVAVTGEEMIEKFDLDGQLGDGKQRFVIHAPKEGDSPESLRSWRDKVSAADVGITSAAGIAGETGTLLLPPLVPDQRAVSLLPDKHIVVAYIVDVVERLDDLFTLGVKGNHFNGNAVFVTGPSRTADIEKELVLGVHGPRALHVVLVQ